MRGKKKATRFPGVRYEEHGTRRHLGRADKYYTIRYYDESGKLQEEGLGWASEGWTAEQAHALRAELRTNVRTGSGPQSLAEMRRQAKQQREKDAKRNLTVAEASKIYLDWARTKKKSWKTDAIWLNKHILPRIGEMRVEDVALEHFEAIQEAMLKDRKALATVNHVLAQLRRLLYFALERGMRMAPNPAKMVSMPDPQNARVRFFSREQADMVLAWAGSWPAKRAESPDFRDACLLSLYTGMRKDEIRDLEWTMVDLRHDVIHLLDTKTVDGNVYINSEVREMLLRRKGQAEDGQRLVFPGPYGGKKISGLSHNFTSLMEEMGYNKGITDRRLRYCFHTLRHTFASWLALEGVDIYRIKELMRHKTITQTMRYAHLIPDVKRDAVELLCRRKPSPPAKP